MSFLRIYGDIYSLILARVSMADKIKKAKHGKHSNVADRSGKDTSGLDVLVSNQRSSKASGVRGKNAAKVPADQSYSQAPTGQMPPVHPQSSQVQAGRAQTTSAAPYASEVAHVHLPNNPHPGLTPLQAARQRTAQMQYGMTPFNATTPTQNVTPVDTAKSLRRRRRKRSIVRAMGIFLGVIVAVVVAGYVGMALYFSDRFMPNSYVWGVDVSLMSSSDAQQAVADAVKDYSLKINGMGFDLDVTGPDTGLRINAATLVKEALSHENSWLWPLELQRDHDDTGNVIATFDSAGLVRLIEDAVNKYNATAEAPVNAGVEYDVMTRSYKVTPESTGTALDVHAVIDAANRALVDLATVSTLDSTALLKPEIAANDTRLVNAANEANRMITADLKLKLGDQIAGEINGDDIHNWVTVDSEYNVTLDREAMTNWVGALAQEFNTVGMKRTYERADGKTITVEGGVYGWEADTESLVNAIILGIDNGEIGELEIPTITSGTAYNGPGKRDWGNRYVDIDLTEQHVYFYGDDGEIIWESDCISGTPDGDHDTSTGVFWLNQKASPSKLYGYENGEQIYESEVQYWMPFDRNIIGLHDADWQPEFGGELYKEGFGSHGCVNLPPDKAQELYGLIQEGDVVVSHW